MPLPGWRDFAAIVAWFGPLSFISVPALALLALLFLLEFFAFAFAEGVAPTPPLPDLLSPPAFLRGADPSCFFPVRFLVTAGPTLACCWPLPSALRVCPIPDFVPPVSLF